MSNQPIQTFAVISDTPIFQQPGTGSEVADGGNAFLRLGQTFSGKTVEHGFVWLSSGIGFVPGHAVVPAYRYQARNDIFVQTDQRPDAPVAEGGTSRIPAGQMFEAARMPSGWLWLLSGVGFTPENNATIVGVAAPTFPPTQPPPPPVDILREYVVQGGDSLSSISEKMYGTQAHAMTIYNVPQNKATIGSSPDNLRPGMNLLIPKLP